MKKSEFEQILNRSDYELIDILIQLSDTKIDDETVDILKDYTGDYERKKVIEFLQKTLEAFKRV